MSLPRLALVATASLWSLLAAAQDAQAPAAEEGAPTTSYTLSPASSDLYVIIRNDTSATLQRLGHDHVIYASSFTGSVSWPNVESASCAIDIAVPVMKLTVDPPGTRGKAGLDDNTIDDGDKSKLQKNMWGDSQLDAASFANITFKGNSCVGREGKVKVSGTLTVRGKAVPVTLTMDVSADGKAFSASGRFTTSHTALGFKPFAGSPIGPRNADALTFVVRAGGTAK